MRFTQAGIVFGILSVPALASAQIKQPGDHRLYNVELEPHLVIEWNDVTPCSNDGFGPGFRASIPFLDNGPIPRINNNMAIGVGLDWAHYSYNCYHAFYNGADLNADVFTLPVVVQWNFFLTHSISVFGEGGLVFRHTRWDYAYNSAPQGCINADGFCTSSRSDSGLDLTLAAGGRFMVSDSVGFLLRLGFPYVSAGVSIEL